jgi:hypothetical protein
MVRAGRQHVLSSKLWAILWLLSFVLLAALLFNQGWSAPSLNQIGGGPDDADARLATWFLAWAPHALGHGLNPLFSASVDYPQGINLMWNTSMVFPALVLTPITAAFGPVVSYNALTTLALSLSAWCAYLAVRALVASQVAAGLAGLLYGFSPFMISHALGQPSVLILLYPPLALLLLNEILIRQRRSSVRLGVWLGLASAAQLLTGEEILATTVMFATVAVGLLALLNWQLVANWQKIRARLGFAIRSLGVSLAVFAPVAAYPLWMQFFGPQRVTGLLPDRYATDLLTFIVPTRLQLFTTPELLTLSHRIITRNLQEESGAYLGVPLVLLLLAVTIVFRSKILVLLAAATAAVVGLLAMGSALQIGGHVTHYHLPGRLLENKPLFRSVVPPRLVPYIFLMVAVLLGVFVAAFMSARTWRARVAGSLATAAALLPLFPALPYPAPPAYTPPFFLSGGDVRRIPEDQVVLVAPFSRAYNSEAMLWQAQSGMRFRMPEGYGWRPGPDRSPAPSSLQTQMGAIQDGTPVPPMTSELRRQLIDDLDRFDVKTIIVGPVHGEAEMVSMFTMVLGSSPDYTGGVYIWWHV